MTAGQLFRLDVELKCVEVNDLHAVRIVLRSE